MIIPGVLTLIWMTKHMKLALGEGKSFNDFCPFNLATVRDKFTALWFDKEEGKIALESTSLVETVVESKQNVITTDMQIMP